MEGPNGPRRSSSIQLIQDKIIIEKNRFYSDTIKIQEPFGTRLKKGAYWKMDTVYLKSTN